MLRRSIDWWKEEKAAQERGFRVIAGIDEAGRGPLAGPVVAGAVILPFGEDFPGVRDSKALTPLQRDAAFELIGRRALSIGVGSADAETIDKQNILKATHLAMRRAVESLARAPDCCLIDGLPVPLFPTPHIALVKGDARSRSIAAASIVAKVTRDRLLADFDRAYPGYGFASNKGYPTPDHIEALRKLGPCPIHRRSFAPVADAEAACSGASPISADGQTSMDVGPRTNAVGLSGEAIAAAYLGALGWTIERTNYHCRGGEVDIVASDRGTLVFVEVKTRSGSPASSPGESVDRRKRGRLACAAEAYIYDRQLGDVVCRFDVVEVWIRPGRSPRVHLTSGAFAADE